MDRRYKTIGIIGGVGPIATAHFFQELLHCVEASCDQDYPRVIIDSDSGIPDRTQALLGNGESPVPALSRAANRLVGAGAEILCLPCNTAHAFLQDVQRAVHVPIVNMVEEVSSHIHRFFPDVKRVGIMATTGTRIACVYDDELSKGGLTAVHLSEKTQEQCVMEAIYGARGIKAGHMMPASELLVCAADELAYIGAEVIVLGCTELPIALASYKLPLLSSTRILAQSVLKQACLSEDSSRSLGMFASTFFPTS